MRTVIGFSSKMATIRFMFVYTFQKGLDTNISGMLILIQNISGMLILIQNISGMLILIQNKTSRHNI